MSDIRGDLEALMRATLRDHNHWTYRAVRPLRVPSSWHHGQSVTSDCSKGVQYLCRWAEAPDPMDPSRNRFGPYGNSTTICMSLQHLSSSSQLLVGDIVTFGWNGDKHAAMVLERGSDPLLWSDGHPGAPNTYRLSRDRRYHQFLHLPVPHYIPTAADKLRAMTGYWAWLQWKLGEGSWKHHTPAAPRVRPNVPLRIPRIWWLWYAHFLVARQPRRANRVRSTTP